MTMTKQFTKGYAVDVRGMSDQPYGEVMFETIKRVGDGVTAHGFAEFKNRKNLKESFLTIHPKGFYIFNNSKDAALLTPTEILGEHLVRAIEEGYTPYFEGDDMPERCYARLDNGYTYDINSESMVWKNKSHHIIACKPIEQPNLDLSKSKTFVVGANKELIEQPSIQTKVLTEKVGPSWYDIETAEDFERLKEVKQNIDKLKAKKINREILKGLIDEMEGKV
jgi:hypothetical protein